MPIIPQGTETAQVEVSAPAAISGTSEARQAGMQIASVGDAIQNFGEKALGMQRDLDYAEASTAINEATLQSFEVAKRSAKPDGSDYGKIAYDTAKPKIESIMNQYGGDWNTKAKLESYVKRVQEDSNTHILVTSGVMLEQNNIHRTEKLGNVASDRIRQNPSSPNIVEAEVSSYGKLLDDSVSKNAITPETSQKLRDKFYETASKSLIEGLDQSGEYPEAIKLLSANQEVAGLSTHITPDMAFDLGMIDSKQKQQLFESGKDYEIPVLTTGKYKLTKAQTEVMNGMSPETKARYLDYFNNKIKEETKVGLHDLMERVRATNSLGRDGKKVDPQEVERALGEVANAVSKKLITPVAGKRIMDEMLLISALSSRIPQIATTSRSRQPEILSSLIAENERNKKMTDKIAPISPGDPVAQLQLENVAELFQKQVIQSNKLQDNDFALHTLMHNPRATALSNAMLSGTKYDADKYANYMINRAEELQVPYPRILTKEFAADEAYKLQGEGDSYQKAKALGALEHRWGENFSSVFDEMSENNKEVGALKVALFAPAQARPALLDAITHEKDINDEFSVKFANDSERKANDVTAAIMATDAALIGDVYSSSSENSSGYEFTKNLRKAMTLQIKRAATKDPSASLSDLAKKAYDDFIGNSFSVKRSKDGRTTLLLPKVINGSPVDTEYVAGFVSVYSTPDGLKNLGLDVPPNYKGNEKAFFEGLSETAKWAMNPSGNGIRLQVWNKSQNRFTTVTRKGKPIEKTFRQINEINDPMVRDEIKSFAGRMFEKATGGAVSVTRDLKDYILAPPNPAKPPMEPKL